MLDIKFVRENPDIVKQNIKNKFQEQKLPLVDEVIELDAKKRSTQQEADKLRAERNKLSKQIGALMGQGKKEEAEAVKKQVGADSARLEELSALEKELDEKVTKIMMVIPNIIDPSVPIGKDDSENVEITKYGEPVVPDFEIPYHTEIMERLDGLDLDIARKVECIHNIDLLRWMMGGEVEEVVGMTDRLNHNYIEAEDFGIALIKFKNGSYGIIEGTTDIYPKNLEETLYIFGEKGTIKAGGQSVNVIEEWRFSDMLDDPIEVKARFHENPPNIYGYGHTPLYADVINAIQQDRQPYVNAMEGKRALELVLAIYQSAAEGKSVKLPINNCAASDFKGRF